MDDRAVVDERDHAHRALALRAFERIDFVDFVDQARPGGARPVGAHARGVASLDLARDDFNRLGRHAPALSPAAVRVPAGVAHQVLEAIRDVSAELCQPIGPGRDLEVAHERLVHA